MRSYKQSNWNPFYNISLKQESASLLTTFTCKLPFLRFHIPTFTCNVCLYLPFCLGIWEPNILTVSKSSQNFPHKNPHQVKAALKGQNSRSLQRIRHAKRCLGSCHCGVVFFVLPVGEDIYIYIYKYAQTGTFADPTVRRFELFFPFEAGVRFFREISRSIFFLRFQPIKCIRLKSL